MSRGVVRKATEQGIVEMKDEDRAGQGPRNLAGAQPRPEKTCGSWKNRSRSSLETESQVTNRRGRRRAGCSAERTRDVARNGGPQSRSREFALVGRGPPRTREDM